MTVAKILPYRPGHPDEQGYIEELQEDAILTMIEEFTTGTHAVCNASNMDTGKTLQASEVVHRMGLEYVLYIGVKDTFQQWADRLEAQSDGAIKLRRIDSTKAGKAAFADWYAGVNGHYFTGSQYLALQDWETILLTENDGSPTWAKDKQKNIIFKDGAPVQATMRHRKGIYEKMKRPVQMLVFDEVHVIANRKSKHRMTLTKIKAENKLGMSGTWVGNLFENAWSITRWLWPDHIDSAFTRWMPQWCATETPLRSGGLAVKDSRGADVMIVRGEKEPGEFVKTLPCYIRIDGESDVPDPEVVYVDLLPQQRADYDDLERDLLVWLNTPAGQRAELVADLPITLRSRLRTATLGVMSIDDESGELFFAPDTQSTKLHALRGIIDRPDWAGEPIAIGTDSKRFAKVVVARMQAAGYPAVLWSGDVSSTERADIKARALRGEVPYLVHTIQSFSTGLDGFQKVFSKVVCLSRSDDNMKMSQWIKRFWRRGRKDNFELVEIVARNTYDEGVLSQGLAETLAMRQTLSLAA